LAVLADGRLVSGGEDGNIKIWPKEGTSEPVVLSRGSPVTSLAMLADGRLASASGWEPVVLSHGSPVLSLAALADGRLASVGDYDGKIKLWPTEGVSKPVVVAQGGTVWVPGRAS
jgi:WD40 repeat protein